MFRYLASIETMKLIRESITMPSGDTILQKVIPQGDIAKYLDGSYSGVRGYITKAEDVKQLFNYDDIYNSLRLDYVGSAFNPITDDCVGVIRFKTNDYIDIEIPYSPAMGGNTIEKPPFRGNGFTGAANGQVVPEFKVTASKSLTLKDGAELYMITKDGTEKLLAIYNDQLEMFIDIMK